MLAALWFLACTFVPARLAPATAPELVADVRAVVMEQAPLPLDADEDLARDKTARLLLVWSIYESGGVTSALGDGGRSCGVMQTAPAFAGETCDRLRADRRVAIRAGLEVMRRSIAWCAGSVRGGLGLYAGGKCGARKALVETRCARAGAC